MLAVRQRLSLAGLALAIFVATAARPQERPATVDWPAVTIEQFLPVETERLTVGTFQAERRPTGVAQPFFLIGCDDQSIDWLKANRARLIELHAFGLVIDAPGLAAYQRLESAAEGLVVRPVAGDLLAEHLGIRHYPVLVTADGLLP